MIITATAPNITAVSRAGRRRSVDTSLWFSHLHLPISQMFELKRSETLAPPRLLPFDYPASSPPPSWCLLPARLPHFLRTLAHGLSFSFDPRPCPIPGVFSVHTLLTHWPLPPSHSSGILLALRPAATPLTTASPHGDLHDVGSLGSSLFQSLSLFLYVFTFWWWYRDGPVTLTLFGETSLGHKLKVTKPSWFAWDSWL